MNALAGSITTDIDDIRYRLEDDGRAIVISNGENLYNISYEGNIVIPSTVIYNGGQYTVVGIDRYTFYNCSGLKSVTISRYTIYHPCPQGCFLYQLHRGG